MNLIGRFVFQRLMGSLAIVDTDGLLHHASGLFQVGGPVQQEFAFENAVDAFCHRILVAVVAIGHGASQSMPLMDFLVVGRAVLDSAVRVVNQRLPRAAAPQRHPECLAHLLGLQAVMHVVADDLAGVGVGHQAEVDEALGGRQVRDVGHPDLLWTGWHNLLGPVLEQVGMPPEAMMAIRGLVVRPLRHHQQASRPKNIEQAVAADLDPSLGEWRAQEMLKLARTQARLAQASVGHQGANLGVSLKPLTLAVLTFVICLSADAGIAAGPADAQPLDELLREDLPEGFFTMRTPCSF